MVCVTSNQKDYSAAYRERIGREELNRRARASYNPERERNYRRNEQRRGETLKRAQLKYFHSMTIEEWEALWDGQGGLCYLCEQPMTRPLPGRGTARGTDAAIEHDHRCCATGRSCATCRRGLAHRLCNAIVGQAGDDPGHLRLIAANLEKRMEVMSHASGN